METHRKLFAVVLTVGLMCLAVPATAESGETIFKTTCARCHGQDGTAHTEAAQKMKVANLRSDYVQNQSDDQLFGTIGQGKNHKQYSHGFLYRGMKESDVRGLIAYVRTLRNKQAVNPAVPSEHR